jgi:hypothetical protein
VDDAHVADQALHHLQHVAREEDRQRPPGDEVLQHPPDPAHRHGVDPLEGLVEEEEPRTVDEGAPERQLLAHPVAVVGDDLPRLVGELQRPEQLLGPLGRGGAIEPVELPVDPQLLRSGQPLEEGEAVRHDADERLDLARVARQVPSEHARPARRRREQPGQHPHGGGLAGTVRPEEAVERPLWNGQRQVGHRGFPVEQPRQVPSLDRLHRPVA